MFIVVADGSFVFNLLLCGKQTYHGVLDLSKIRQGQCQLIIFQIAKHGWTVIYCGDCSWQLRSYNEF